MRAAQPVAATDREPQPPGQIVANPGGGSFMCPVFGAAYTDDYGGPRGHPGNDLFVPIGTQAIAVKAGTVRYVANEGAGGNTAYLLRERREHVLLRAPFAVRRAAHARCHRAR